MKTKIFIASLFFASLGILAFTTAPTASVSTATTAPVTVTLATTVPVTHDAGPIRNYPQCPRAGKWHPCSNNYRRGHCKAYGSWYHVHIKC